MFSTYFVFILILENRLSLFAFTWLKFSLSSYVYISNSTYNYELKINTKNHIIARIFLTEQFS